MLRGIAKLSLRRGIHTTNPSGSVLGFSRHRLAMAAGASVITATFLGWQIYSENRRIALDSDTTCVLGSFLCSHLPSSLTRVFVATVQLTARVPPAQFVETPSIPSSDTPESQAENLDEKGGMPLEEEGSSQGAFDPVTGKINWDCPCLGGMAYGPCGMQFREAFSCFVFSEEEPKGIDCVERFKAMQNCFRENPDVYGEEIMNDDDEGEEVPAQSNDPGDTIPTSTASAPTEPSQLQAPSYPA
ncbi:intermembrane space import and assembly protein 40 [Multifurca ochricompacta]|uniref:Mitochondrial intermembrane space import and assembly protein 40 n=1 Tax=Multifurca ochricompacta TaxID=376703 RepID=A0AAD4QN82_9AGAM|nr:intermembrane space import and assembly protein 40 [Multifurca ochricompacta]